MYSRRIAELEVYLEIVSSLHLRALEKRKKEMT